MLRSSKHNDKTWGLPGGNADVGDASLLETAKREAIEEMGMLPGSFNDVKEHKVMSDRAMEVLVCRIYQGFWCPTPRGFICARGVC